MTTSARTYTTLRDSIQAIAIQPGDPEFADLMKRTVDAMREDGTLSALSLKWFSIDLTTN